MNKKSFFYITLPLFFFTSENASAVVCNITSSAPEVVTQGLISSTNGLLTATNSTLINIGSAINSQGDRQATLISQAFDKQREFEIAQKKQDRQLEIINKYKIPDDICAASLSGGVSGAKSSATKGAGGKSLAGGSKNEAVKKAYGNPPVATDVDSAAVAINHKDYCSESDSRMYGGTKFCPAVSDLPDADTQVSSVLHGAAGKNTDNSLTFSEEQTDAALLYTKNTAGRSAGRIPSKGEAESAAGRVYLGMMKEYQAYIDAAQEPQLSLIAASKPNPATKKPLEEAMKVPSMKFYYDSTVSPEAKKNGMSLRELEAFEVGRRFDNPAYQSELASKNDTELLKELVQTQAVTNYLLLENKRQQEKNNILTGQLLALSAYQQYKDKIDNQVNTLNQAVSKTGK